MYFRGITTGQEMCDLLLQEAKVMLSKVKSNKKATTINYTGCPDVFLVFPAIAQ